MQRQGFRYAVGALCLGVAFVVWAEGSQGSEEEETSVVAEEAGDTASADTGSAWVELDVDVDTGFASEEDTDVPSEAMAMSLNNEDPGRGRSGSRWATGILDGEIKYSDSDPVAYDADDAVYNQIDPDQMGLTSGDFGLELFVMDLPHEADYDLLLLNKHSLWQDMVDLLDNKYHWLYDDPTPPPV